MVLLNLVLNNLAIHFLSFYKAPKSIIKSIIKIQRVFLWGRIEKEEDLLV